MLAMGGNASFIYTRVFGTALSSSDRTKRRSCHIGRLRGLLSALQGLNAVDLVGKIHTIHSIAHRISESRFKPFKHGDLHVGSWGFSQGLLQQARQA